MRAYFAILKDSFREAMASRVLWCALIGICVVLLLLAPFGLRKDVALQLRSSEVTNAEKLITRFVAEREQDGTSSAFVWSTLTTEQQKSFESFAVDSTEESGPGRRPHSRMRQLLEFLNRVIEETDVYDKASWTNVTLNTEAQNLVDIEAPNQDELERRNLLLLAAAYPRCIEIKDNQSLSLVYAGAEVIGEIPIPPSQFNAIFEQGVVAALSVFLGFFGILGSLLVTAGVIPRTFEPGEISLLLSKPVHRSMLFLTKFFGGCTFTLLYSTVLVVGIWFLLGIRMNYWQINLLWCIPVYLFLFMIYFSVAAVAGAIWRNSIVALVLVILFWVGLTVVEVTKDQLKEHLITNRTIREIVVAGESLLAVDGSKTTYTWTDDQKEAWDEVFVRASDQMPRFVRQLMSRNFRMAPVYDDVSERILALQFGLGRFGGMSAPELVAGNKTGNWERVSLGQLPQTVKEILIDSNGRILLPAKDTIYEYVGASDENEQRPDLLGSLSFGLLGRGGEFKKVHGDDFPEFQSFASAIHSDRNAIYIFDSGTLHRLLPDDEGMYCPVGAVDLKTDEAGVLAATGQHGLLALADGTVNVFDVETLETVSTFQLPQNVVPRICVASPDGKSLALLTHAQTVFLWDAETGIQNSWESPINGSCYAIAFSLDGELLMSDSRRGVHRYVVGSNESNGSWQEATNWVYPFYENIVCPIWSYLPKPSQLDGFVPYVMNGNEAVAAMERRGPPGMNEPNSLEQSPQVFDVASVIRSNVIFIVIVLGIGCFYVSRHDY